MILYSPGQAAKDFTHWANELGPINGKIAVLFIDLDDFKPFNTKYTETRIDRTLLDPVMRLVESLVRSRGGAYRYGGDEFVILLPNHDTAESVAFAEMVRKAVECQKFDIDGQEEQISLSGGVALWPVHGLTFDEVRQKANDAKAVAKNRKNCIRLADVTEGALLPRSGLSEPAQKLAALLNQKSQTGTECDPIIDAEAVRVALMISEEALAMAADELEERQWVVLSRTSGMGKAGFTDIYPATLLFIETDATLKGWNPRADAKALASILVAKEDGAFLSEMDQKLSWGPRRLNPAASILALQDCAEVSGETGAHPYAFHWMRATPRTRRFAQEP